MDEKTLKKLLDLERKVRASRQELDSLAEVYDLSDDYFVKNKLKYLQAEIDYLNNQCALLSSFKEEASRESAKAIPTQSEISNSTQAPVRPKPVPVAHKKVYSTDAPLEETEEPKTRVWLRKDEEAINEPVEEVSFENTEAASTFDTVYENIEKVENVSNEFDTVQKTSDEFEAAADAMASEELSIDEVAKKEAAESAAAILAEDDEVIEDAALAAGTIATADSIAAESVEAIAEDTTKSIAEDAVESITEKATETIEDTTEAITEEKAVAEEKAETAEEASSLEEIKETTEDMKAAVEETAKEEPQPSNIEEAVEEKAPAVAPKDFEYEVEETFEIKSIPESVLEEEKKTVKKPEKKKASLENRIGLLVMPVLAAILIFSAVILLASALPPSIGNILKQITMVVAGAAFVGTGLFLHKKKKGGAFGQVLMGIGAGELFVSIVVFRFVFKSINDLGLFIVIFLWSVLLIILKKFANIMFQIIGEIGVSIAINFGVCYSLAIDNHAGMFVILLFYVSTAFLYYLLFKVKGNIVNFILFHSFNIINIIFLSTGAICGVHNGLLASGILGLICALCLFASTLDIIVTCRGEDAFDGIFGSIFNFIYAMCMFVTACLSMVHITLFTLGRGPEIYDNGPIRVLDALLNARWSAITVPCVLIAIVILLVEFIWKQKIAKYASEALLLFVMMCALICSHETFMIGFFVAMFGLTVLGYIRNNHVLKIAALLFYITYAFLPGEDIMRMVVGLAMAAMVIAFLYTVKEQYNLAYKICIYFSLIIYAVMISFSVFDTSSTFGIKYVVIVAFVSLLNLLMMFTPLSKNKEKEFDFRVIAELMNMIVTPAALILAAIIAWNKGTVGYVPLLISFILVLVSIFWGFLQNRILCRINAIATLLVGTVALYQFDFSAFWYSVICISSAIVLMYTKKERYSFIEKLAYYLLLLGYCVTCTLYFKDVLIYSSVFGTVNVILIAMVAVVLLFKFTGLSLTAEGKVNDFELVTLITGILLVLEAIIKIKLEKYPTLDYVPFAVIVLISLIWLIHGFVKGKKKEKIAVLATLFVFTLQAFNMKPEYIAYSVGITVLYLIFLYAKKEAYHIAYKEALFVHIIIDCVLIPYLYFDEMQSIPYFGARGIILVALMLATMLFKFTALSKNAESKESDIYLSTFVVDIASVVFAAYLIIDYHETGNIVPTIVLSIITLAWVLRGFLANRVLEKIAFLCSLVVFGALSYYFVPGIYTILILFFITLFIAALYIKKESYSVWFKVAIYIITIANCIICPVLFIDSLSQVAWLDVGCTVLVCMFIVSVLFKFTILAKNADSLETDFYWGTFATECVALIYAMILMPIFKNEGNYIPSAIIAAIAFIWVIHGFVAERFSEKIAALAEAFLLITIAAFFVAPIYVLISGSLIAVYIYCLYAKDGAYSFVIKVLLYALSMINAVIWPLLFNDTLSSLPVLVTMNAIFLLWFIVNTIFRFTPLVQNPDTEVRDMRMVTIIMSHILIVIGIGITFTLDAPADILSCMLTILLVPIGTAWIWRDDDDEDTSVLIKYFAITEYIFVPFILCYALAAPNYVSSVIGLALAVGCVILGFALKMKGVRIYGIVVSMIMIFKLALIDFEKSSLVAYAVSFLIAGISCLVISMVYYFVNAAMGDKE